MDIDKSGKVTYENQRMFGLCYLLVADMFLRFFPWPMAKEEFVAAMLGGHEDASHLTSKLCSKQNERTFTHRTPRCSSSGNAVYLDTSKNWRSCSMFQGYIQSRVSQTVTQPVL